MRSKSTALSRGRTAGTTSSESPGGLTDGKYDRPYLRVCGRAGSQDDTKSKVTR
jgi:hypothetical protein